MTHFTKSKGFCEDALKIILDITGPDHTDVFLNKQKLGTIALGNGEFDEAKKLLDEALEGQRWALGEDDPDTLDTMTILKRVQTARVSATNQRGKKRRTAPKGTATTTRVGKRRRSGRYSLI